MSSSSESLILDFFALEEASRRAEERSTGEGAEREVGEKGEDVDNGPIAAADPDMMPRKRAADIAAAAAGDP